MSLYNMLFGCNYLSPLYLAFLELTSEDTGRFRDCFLQATDDGEFRIVIYTRNGGGNREDYEDVTEKLRAHPEFVTDFDDGFDCTYASYVFKVPEKYKDAVAKLAKQPDQQVDPGARFRQLLEDLKNGNDTPAAKHAFEVGKQILEPVFEKLNEQTKKEG